MNEFKTVMNEIKTGMNQEKKIVNDRFSLNRLALLVRSSVINNFRNWATTTLTLAAILFFAALLSSGDSGDFYHFWFSFLLMFLGIVFTSRAFLELHDKTRNQAFLLIPASALEKTIAQIFITSLGFFLYLLVFMTLVSLVFESSGAVFFGSNKEFFNPFAADVWKVLPVYLFLHSLYFLGAAWFRKLHLIKTTLSLSVLMISMGLLIATTIQIFFAPYLDDLELFIEPVFRPLYETQQTLLRVGTLSIVALLVVACWTIAWQRLEEAQVSDGV